MGRNAEPKDSISSEPSRSLHPSLNRKHQWDICTSSWFSKHTFLDALPFIGYIYVRVCESVFGRQLILDAFKCTCIRARAYAFEQMLITSKANYEYILTSMIKVNKSRIHVVSLYSFRKSFSGAKSSLQCSKIELQCE